MKKSNFAKIHIVELKPGTVEYLVPSDASFPYLMVYNDKGSSTSWGRIPKPGKTQRAFVGGFLKKSWGHCQLTWSVDGVDYHSQKIHIGWNKLTGENLERENWAAEYRKIITYCRQRIHVHENLQKKAVLHMRPAGREAHGEAIMLFTETLRNATALLNENKLELHSVMKHNLVMAKSKGQWAMGQDGVNPPPPEQKWYKRENGTRYLKAKDQWGFDRRPHELEAHSYRCQFFPFGGLVAETADFCFEEDWDKVARGQKTWKPLKNLACENMGKQISNTTIYIKTGPEKYEVCSFFVPKRKSKPITPTNYISKPRQAMIEQVTKWRNDPLWKHLKAHTDRWDSVLALLGVDNSFQKMPLYKIELLAKKPWGHRWRKLLKFIKEYNL